MKEYFDIRLPCNPKMMSLVRKTVAQACSMVGFADKQAGAIVLAVDESCTNIIRHCYSGTPGEGQIVIRVRLFDDRIEIILRDFGEGVDVEKLRLVVEKRKKQLEAADGSLEPGGLGVMLVHEIMDKVQYKSSQESGTVLRLVKFLPEN